jgi:TetR/AcrR family transcriptional repressor of nem operon
MGRCSDARDRLLATAARLVHERGYTAVSVADICVEAGLKKGSFYHFFPSKHALVLATLERFADYQEARMQAATDSGTSAREQLVGMLTGMYHGFLAARRTYGVAHGCALGNLAQEMAHRDPELRAALGSIFLRWQARLSLLLEHAPPARRAPGRQRQRGSRSHRGLHAGRHAAGQGHRRSRGVPAPGPRGRGPRPGPSCRRPRCPRPETAVPDVMAFGDDQCCDPVSACQVRGDLS